MDGDPATGRADRRPSFHVMLANGTLYGAGAEQVIATLARHLRTAGHRVTVAVMAEGGVVQEELRAEGFEVISGLARDSRMGLVSVATRLRNIVTERCVNVVHTHDLRSLADVGICRLVTRTFRHIHTFHFGNYPHLPQKQLWLERLCSRLPDLLVAVGDAQRQALIEALKLPPRSVQTIWNGVDAAGPQANGFVSAPQKDVPLIGSVGTFIPQKGLPTLLQAAALLRGRGIRFRLVLAGEGPMRHSLQADVARLDLGEVVEFTGWLPDASKSVIPRLDIFVQSSYWEAMSVVVLEAMAAGRAILATSVGENPRILKDGVSALLVPPRDAEALASGLARLIQDRSLRDRLGDSAHVSHATAFTGAAMAERYLAVYEQMWQRVPQLAKVKDTHRLR